MSLPRQVLKGCFYFISRRCAQREYLLTPDTIVNNAFVYCMAIAAKLAGVDILATCTMSNHHHTVIYDRHGTFPVFIQHAHKLIAKCLNLYRDRWENFWAAKKCNVVRLVDPADVIDKIVYTITNPVRAHLVERAVDWPGVNTHGLHAIEATRPTFFFRQYGRCMRAKITLDLVIPPELGPHDKIRRLIDERVREVEDSMIRERESTLRRVLGAAAVQRQKPTTRPKTDEPRRTLNPTIAALDREARIGALLAYKDFLVRYRRAYQQWKHDKRKTRFPEGTYLMARQGAPIENTA
jgi:REP-associated tyrosine transposase